MWDALITLAWLTVTDARSQAAVQAPSRDAQTTSAPAPGERIAEIRIQGNYRTPQDEIERLASVRVGDPVQDDTLNAIQKRLEDTGLFDEVSVHKRWRTIEPGADVVLLILVRERPSGSSGPLGHVTRALGNPMVLPILGYEDGYGLSYGARLSPPDLLGEKTHLSIPLTWGGTRQAAVEVDRRFASGALTSLSANVAIRQRENPYYDEDDTRRIVGARVQRTLGPWMRAGASAGWTDVEFAAVRQNFLTWGADVSFDTRSSLDFPRNAVYLQAAWERMDVDEGPAIDRYRTEARAYLGLTGAAVLALRAVRADASEPVPPYEQYLLGGSSSVRGFRAGFDAGDTLLAGSAELRVPLTSPVSFGSAGAKVFADSGTVYGDDERLGRAVFRTGIGGGLFFAARLFSLDFDVARGLDSGYRAHFSAGLRF